MVFAVRPMPPLTVDGAVHPRMERGWDWVVVMGYEAKEKARLPLL